MDDTILKFPCGLCFIEEARNPVACNRCGIYYCNDCLKNIYDNYSRQCMQCGSDHLTFVNGENEQNQQKGFSGVTKFIQEKIGQIEQAFDQLQKPKEGLKASETYIEFPDLHDCANFQICKQKTNSNSNEFCSSECLLYSKLIDSFTVQKWNEFRKLVLQPNKEIIATDYPNQFYNCKLAQFALISKCPEIKVNQAKAICETKSQKFNNVFSSIYFTNGLQYWKVHVNGIQGDAKIGVSKVISNTCFSDGDQGWAFYTIGQLRHNSASQGIKYGYMQKNLVIGVFLDMINGIIKFSQDDQYQGVAFQDERLKQGSIYAAFALQNGCSVTVDFPDRIPRFFF